MPLEAAAESVDWHTSLPDDRKELIHVQNSRPSPAFATLAQLNYVEARSALILSGQLADEPRPLESFPYGSPDLRRLRTGRYRVFYTIDEEWRVVQIDHVARLP